MSEWTTWTERIAAWRASGLSAEKFCVGREFSVHSLRNWRRRQLEAERLPPKEAMKLARVSLVPTRALPRPEARGSGPAGIAVEVGSARVIVDRDFDRATLIAVLEVVSSARAEQA